MTLLFSFLTRKNFRREKTKNSHSQEHLVCRAFENEPRTQLLRNNGCCIKLVIKISLAIYWFPMINYDLKNHWKVQKNMDRFEWKWFRPVCVAMSVAISTNWSFVNAKSCSIGWFCSRRSLVYMNGIYSIWLSSTIRCMRKSARRCLNKNTYFNVFFFSF